MARRRSGEKRIVSIRTDAVWIETGHLLWSTLPPAIQKVLLGGLERIAATREALGESAKVPFLPPIQIKCELWRAELDTLASINGRAIPVRYGRDSFFGVELSAHVCASEDESLIRALLVHEYLHVFDAAQRVVQANAEVGGVCNLGSGDPFSADNDNAHLAKPEDWFSDPQDWDLVRHGDDEWMQRFDAGQVLLNPYLRHMCPDFRYKEPGVTFAVEWLEHARSLTKG
jgi:hypothetical protein